jgi:hypothetical protein
LAKSSSLEGCAWFGGYFLVCPIPALLLTLGKLEVDL